MKRIFILLFLLPIIAKAQVYQSMPQAGYGAVKRMLFDSVLTLPLGIAKLQNISGGRDTGQIRYNKSDSSIYIYSGSAWRKVSGGGSTDTTSLSNRINTKLSSISGISPIITTTGITPVISTSMATNKLIGRSTTGTGVMEEISIGSGLTLSGGSLTNTATPTPIGYYGAWQDNNTQTAAVSNIGYPIIFRTIDLSNGVSVNTNGTNLTRITFANTGVYNLQFSSQFQNTDNAQHDINIWLRLNGSDVAGSSGLISIPARKASGEGNEGHIIAGWNYLLNVVAGQYYEIVWSTSNAASVTMQYYSAGNPPPSAASVILTVTQQSGIMAGTGITAINNLTGSVQTMVTGTDSTDFKIVSSGTQHKFNLPTASATKRGALSSADWSTFNSKMNLTDTTSLSTRINSKVSLTGNETILGLKTLQNSGTQGDGQLGAELLSGSGWTSTGWNDSYPTFTHIVTATNVLSNTLAAVNANFYQIAYTITSRTAGTVDISFGGVSTIGVSSTGAIGIKATSTGNLTITPTADFDGSINISIKLITAGTATVNFSSTAGTVTNEIRAGSTNSNTFIGYDAGRRNTTGFGNTFIGFTAGRDNTTAINNTFVGSNSGFVNTTGSNNTFVGQTSGQANTTGSGNVGIGLGSLFSNTTGTRNVAIGGQSTLSSTSTISSNIAIGFQSFSNLTTGSANVSIGDGCGRLIGNSSFCTDASNTILIGSNTRTNSNSETNQIVIGSSSIGLGSNSTVLGNTGTTKTGIYGRTLIGTTLPTDDLSNALQVNGSIKSTNLLDTLEKTYTGAITWGGGTAPSGTTNHTYRWTRTGKLVTLYIKLLYSTAGTGNTNVIMAMPSDAPLVADVNGLTATGEFLYPGSGTFRASSTISGAQATDFWIRNGSVTASTREMYCYQSAGTATTRLWATFQYFTP